MTNPIAHLSKPCISAPVNALFVSAEPPCSISHPTPKASHHVQIPEHTWGFDTKTFLHDQSNWTNKAFHAQLDGHAQNYEDNVAQWQRQRGYMTWALEALDQPHGPLAPTPDAAHGDSESDGLSAELVAGVRAEWRRQHELTDLEGYEEHPVGEPLRLKSQYWQIEVNTTTGNATPWSQHPTTTASLTPHQAPYSSLSLCSIG